MADGSVGKLKRAKIISLIHKFDRRDDMPFMNHMICAFSHGMSILSSDETNKMKGSVTNILFRTGVTLFEDGVANHMSSSDRQKAVTFFFAARRTSLLVSPDWVFFAENLVDVFVLMSGVYRCRSGSVTKSFVHHLKNQNQFGMLEILDLTNLEKEVLSEVNYERCQEIKDAKKSSMDFIVPYQAAVQFMRSAAMLIDPKDEIGKLFANSDELRKVIYCAAHCQRLITTSGVIFADQNIPTVRSQSDFLFQLSEPFTMEYTIEIGANDQHVNGITNDSTRAVFLDAGCRVTNPSPYFKIGGLDYQALESIYISVSGVLHAEMANKKKEEQKNKRNLKIKQNRSEKKPKKTHRNVSPPEGTTVPIFDMDSLLRVDVVAGDRILGFKNFTITGTLIAPEPKIVTDLGASVFLKVGEDVSCTTMTIQTTDARRKLGLKYVDCVMVGVRMDFEWWRRQAQLCHNIDPRGTNTKNTYVDWMNTVTGSFCHIKDGQVATGLLQKKFDGIRLTLIPEGDSRLKTHTFGKSLVQNLLFSKWIGTTDLGPYNLMIDSCGHVLQVDVGPASALQIQKYNKQGLFTSHHKQFVTRFRSAARHYASFNHDEIQVFLEDLVVHASLVRCHTVKMPSAMEVVDLLKVS